MKDERLILVADFSRQRIHHRSDLCRQVGSSPIRGNETAYGGELWLIQTMFYTFLPTEGSVFRKRSNERAPDCCRRRSDL
jgi:hypothetical protein